MRHRTSPIGVPAGALTATALEQSVSLLKSDTAISPAVSAPSVMGRATLRVVMSQQPDISTTGSLSMLGKTLANAICAVFQRPNLHLAAADFTFSRTREIRKLPPAE